MTRNSTFSVFGILYIMELEKLFKEYYRPLCLYSLRFTLDTDAAEDIVQECFTALLSHRADKPVPYLYASVRNRSLMWLRSRKPMEELPEDLPMEEAIDSRETPGAKEKVPGYVKARLYELCRYCPGTGNLPEHSQEQHLQGT